MTGSVIPVMGQRLCALYNIRENLRKIGVPEVHLTQLNEDIEMLETLIMYKSNRFSRGLR